MEPSPFPDAGAPAPAGSRSTGARAALITGVVLVVLSLLVLAGAFVPARDAVRTIQGSGERARQGLVVRVAVPGREAVVLERGTYHLYGFDTDGSRSSTPTRFASGTDESDSYPPRADLDRQVDVIGPAGVRVPVLPVGIDGLLEEFDDLAVLGRLEVRTPGRHDINAHGGTAWSPEVIGIGPAPDQGPTVHRLLVTAVVAMAALQSLVLGLLAFAISAVLAVTGRGGGRRPTPFVPTGPPPGPWSVPPGSPWSGPAWPGSTWSAPPGSPWSAPPASPPTWPGGPAGPPGGYGYGPGSPAGAPAAPPLPPPPPPPAPPPSVPSTTGERGGAPSDPAAD
jgi:hypothetical protein